MTEARDPVAGRWARLRFSIVGHLLMAPPPRGELRAALAALARRGKLVGARCSAPG